MMPKFAKVSCPCYSLVTAYDKSQESVGIFE
jgi:hypothetical protein